MIPPIWAFSTLICNQHTSHVPWYVLCTFAGGNGVGEADAIPGEGGPFGSDVDAFFPEQTEGVTSFSRSYETQMSLSFSSYLFSIDSQLLLQIISCQNKSVLIRFLEDP
jgi:hypothetical protein